MNGCDRVFLAFSLLLTSVGCVVPTPSPAQGTISSEEARQIAFEALSPEQKKLPAISLEDESTAGRCHAFEALFDNPGPGSIHVDFLLVDTRTGEVWHGPNPPCEHVSSLSLGQLQEKLRAKHRIPEADAVSSRHEAPCCVKE